MYFEGDPQIMRCPILGGVSDSATLGRLVATLDMKATIPMDDRHTLAPSNTALVRRTVEICERHGRPVATWRPAREMLGLRAVV